MSNREEIGKRIEGLKSKKANKSSAVKQANWKVKIALMLGLSLAPKIAEAQNTTTNNGNQLHKTEQVARPDKHQASDSVDSQIVDNETGLRAAAAAMAADPDFMAEFLAEEGLNTAKNFDLNSVEWTGEMVAGIQSSDWGNSVAQKANTVHSNPDDRHCYRSVKDILQKSGIILPRTEDNKHAYQAVSYLRKMPEFSEISCSYEDLSKLPAGTVVVQGKGNTASGHIFIMGMDKTQKCGRPNNHPHNALPTSNRRGSSGQHYGDLYVFIPSQCSLNSELTAEMYSNGTFKGNAVEIIMEAEQREGSKNNVKSAENEAIQPAQTPHNEDVKTVEQNVQQNKEMHAYNPYQFYSTFSGHGYNG